jgi:hypothetical protein
MLYLGWDTRSISERKKPTQGNVHLKIGHPGWKEIHGFPAMLGNVKEMERGDKNQKHWKHGGRNLRGTKVSFIAWFVFLLRISSIALRAAQEIQNVSTQVVLPC